MKPQDITAEYFRGLEAGRKDRARMGEQERKERIAEAKRTIKRAGTDYEIGPWWVGYRDGLEGA